MANNVQVVTILPKELNKIIFEYAREYTFVKEFNTILNKKYNLGIFKICPIIKFFIGKKYRYYRSKLDVTSYTSFDNNNNLQCLLSWDNSWSPWTPCIWKILNGKFIYDYFDLSLVYFHSKKKENYGQCAGIT